MPPLTPRRTFVKLGATAVALSACAPAAGRLGAPGPTMAPGPTSPSSPPSSPLAVLPPLPFAPDALAPVISRETLELHHGRHHAGYVKNLARLLAEPAFQASGLAPASLEDLVRATAGQPALAPVYRNAAQHWNHSFLWQSLSPQRATPSGALAALVARDFGGPEALDAALVKAGLEQFGSGWAWLVVADGRLAVEKTPDADSPLTRGVRPLLALDVWEHAYYVDYRSDRRAYLEALVGQRLNWEHASQALES